MTNVVFFIFIFLYCGSVCDGLASDLLVTFEPGESDIVKTLDAHNEKRRIPYASNMRLMEWSAELQEQAQIFVEKCKFEHEPDLNGVGENLHIGNYIIVEMFTHAVAQWYDEEVDFYDYNTTSCKAPPNKMCSHYTQLVWSTSFQVGCAIAQCKDIEGTPLTNGYLISCRYSPGGNHYTAGGFALPPYQLGESCSACPDDWPGCDDGLCSRDSAETTALPTATAEDKTEDATTPVTAPETTTYQYTTSVITDESTDVIQTTDSATDIYESTDVIQTTEITTEQYTTSAILDESTESASEQSTTSVIIDESTSVTQTTDSATESTTYQYTTSVITDESTGVIQTTDSTTGTYESTNAIQTTESASEQSTTSVIIDESTSVTQTTDSATDVTTDYISTEPTTGIIDSTTAVPVSTTSATTVGPPGEDCVTISDYVTVSRRYKQRMEEWRAAFDRYISCTSGGNTGACGCP